MEILRRIGTEEAMQEIPELLEQQRYLQKKKIDNLRSSGNNFLIYILINLFISMLATFYF